jgi:hypothetical protein
LDLNYRLYSEVCPDHSDASTPDWPAAYVRLERVKGEEERKWKHNKWVWRSNGMVQHEGYAAEIRICAGVFRCASCGRLTRPKTNPSTRSAQIRGGCKSRTCSAMAALVHDTCEARSFHYTYTRGEQTVMIWEDFGDHGTHDRPPGGTLSKFEEDQVVLQTAQGSSDEGYVPPGGAKFALGSTRQRTSRLFFYWPVLTTVEGMLHLVIHQLTRNSTL